MISKIDQTFNLKTSLTLFFLVTIISGFVYTSVQQNYRQSANDPQLQIARDAKTSLESGANPKTQIGPMIDLRKSLAVFEIVYDNSGNIVASSAVLDGAAPDLPISVLNRVRDNGEWVQTWQPKDGVREAAVVERLDGQRGFILVGRSLKEVENRVDRLTAFVWFAWVASVLVMLLIPIAVSVLSRLLDLKYH